MSERPDPFEEELREALRSGDDVDSAGDSSDLLRRIHRGVARRRARRRVGALAATAVLAGTVIAAVPLIGPTPSSDQTATGPADQTRPSQERGSRPAADLPRRIEPMELRSGEIVRLFPSADVAHPRGGDPVEVVDVQVTSVSGSSASEYWISGSGDCADRICNVLGHSAGDDELRYTALPGGRRQTQTDVRFSGDGQTGWATNGIATFRTDDGGTEWTRLEQPAGVTVTELEAWGSEVWAVGRRETETVVLTEASGSGQLQEVASSARFLPDQGVALGPGSFGLPVDAAEPEFAHTGDGGAQWDRSRLGCRPTDISASADAVWALCGGPAPALVRSVDRGATWESPEPLDTDIDEATATVAAIDVDTAFVTSGGDGWVVDASYPVLAGGLGEGPYVYAGFTTENVGYVVDVDGNLCRSTDGGLTWERVHTS
jgi:photosystem II stability/assembly factor-like uncharacterized protein